ncbi:MAG: C69 family dipeptidase [Oscillospiraceae bacterium]|jgi:dipeptidase|nr:C69 family dipeptidase [Oscillospiraceae bacterium]
MKRRFATFGKRAAAVSLTVVFFVVTAIGASACTSFYLGKGTTENGAVIWGRSEDISARYAKLYRVHPAETHGEGEDYVSSTGFRWPYPAQTLRYTYVADSVLNEGYTPEPYAEAGINEKNVAISATVTLSGMRTAITGSRNTLGLDTLVSTQNGGLAETDLTSVVLMQATSARHAVELVAEVVDTVGAAGTEGFMVSDPDEVWYMQLLSGHQYVAVKAPADKIGFSPNMPGNVDVSDVENVVASPGLISVAQQAGTLRLDEAGFIKIADSYANLPTSVAGRLWLGANYLHDEETAKALTPGYISYFQSPRPEKNYTLYEALRLLAYRGEGTSKDAGSGTGNSSAIGNDGTVEAHVFETRDDLPTPLATVEWLSIAPPEFGVYLPFYGALVTETYEMYGRPDTASYNNADPDANSMYWVFRELYTLCKGPRDATELGSRALRTRYGAGVQAFWERYQKSLIAQQTDVDAAMVEIYEHNPALAQKKATDISKAISEEAYVYAKALLRELKAFQAAGTTGAFVPSLLADESALPTYAGLLTVLSAPAPVLEPGADASLSASVTVDNISASEAAATLIVALYAADGRLLGTQTETAALPSFTETALALSANSGAAAYARAFVWQSDMAPIGGAQALPLLSAAD